METPIQRTMREDGVNALVAFLTLSTCGEACWQAREDVCRCSCGGKNHGCLRDASGERPVRTARIDGYRYRLAGVSADGSVYGDAKRINEAAPMRRIGTYTYYWSETERGAPARVKPATKDQFRKWPELRAARERYEEARESAVCAAQYLDFWPYLLWVREDS